MAAGVFNLTRIGVRKQPPGDKGKGKTEDAAYRVEKGEKKVIRTPRKSGGAGCGNADEREKQGPAQMANSRNYTK